MGIVVFVYWVCYVFRVNYYIVVFEIKDMGIIVFLDSILGFWYDGEIIVDVRCYIDSIFLVF